MAEQPQTATSSLPPETLDFAHRIFDAARSGNAPLLLQAVDAGLPVNLTNAQGTYPSSPPIPIQDHDNDNDGNISLYWLTAMPISLRNTLLMLAAYAGHTDLTNGLLARNADPNRLNDRGQSIVAGAVFKAHDEIVRALVAAGADPRLGKPTAIETAHMFGRKDLLEVLGAKEGDITKDVPTPPSAPPQDAPSS
ncbi:hypothetical protein J3R83DRAFT_9143 [Lanmaoa asiatica]|nr:hypothetical protein J3R83DRAFT_9143 [Lanmaoa asiatica]